MAPVMKGERRLKGVTFDTRIPRIHIVIVGPQGTGKTRIAREILIPALLQRGLRVLMNDGMEPHGPEEFDLPEGVRPVGRLPYHVRPVSVRIDISAEEGVERAISQVVSDALGPQPKRKGRARQ